MKLGIVGVESAKLTFETKSKATTMILDLIDSLGADTIVSGGCHLGGIDILAIELATDLGLKTIVHKPRFLSWQAGYKPRNMKIAKDSDHVFCLTIRQYPGSYHGMRFNRCYHCGTSSHVKSGGCWTVKYAKSIGKIGEVIVL